MQRSFVHFAMAALMIISLAACTDHRELLAPTRPNAATSIGGGGLGGPPPFTSPTDLMEISAGNNHTCVRRRDGQIYCWGMNLHHQTGDTSNTFCGLYPPSIPCTPLPVRVRLPLGNGTSIPSTRVTAGWEHTCALDTLKTAWCWGLNDNGQTGIGSNSPTVPIPTRVAGSQTAFNALSAGGNGTCGSVVGLWCWGSYPQASYPYPRTPNFMIASALNPLVVSDADICGNSGGGQWVCWGGNGSGQLGVDPATTTSIPYFSPAPAINGATNVSLYSGDMCVDQPTGVTQCFGRNTVASSVPPLPTFGLLGNPSFTGTNSFVPQTSGAFHGIVVSSDHACALDSFGNAFCWGVNDSGDLGNGTQQGSSTPQMVLGGLTFKALAVGRTHTCGITTNNHVWCWGDNYVGEIGAPTPGQTTGIPVKAM
jgi:hypothetical protein